MTMQTQPSTTQPSTSTPVNEPTLPEAKMHLCRPTEPVTAVVTKNEPCTRSAKAAGFVRHVEFDVSGTPLEGSCLPGQAIGVLAEGDDEKGRPHRVRLYSLASPTKGEDGAGRILSTTVKRTIDEHWETGKLFLGVASNYLCDRQVGDEIRVSGPNGKRFLLPEDPSAHDYVFFSTGTGIAPFRGMLKDLAAAGFSSRCALIAGSPYSTDLLYHRELEAIAAEHERFTYLTAVSREDNVDSAGRSVGRVYVQDRISTDAGTLIPLLESERTLIYVCGIAGMELGIFQQLARRLPSSALEQYIQADKDTLEAVDGWDRRMLHKQVKLTRRVMLEVYA